MRGAVTLLLLGAAALLASCAAQEPSPTPCNLSGSDHSDPAGLSSFIKQLLIDARPRIAEEADPINLPDHRDGDLEATNIRINGVSDFNVSDLSVTFPQEKQIAVRATIIWPHINGTLNVKTRQCKTILWRQRCVEVRAQPDVSVEQTVGSLTTTLNVNVNVSSDGQINVTSSGTDVTLNMVNISVKANVSEVIGIFSQLFRDSANMIATRLANNWWVNNKGKVETKARDALDKAIREKVAVHLGRLLRL